jgi:hypothetical protein
METAKPHSVERESIAKGRIVPEKSHIIDIKQNIASPPCLKGFIHRIPSLRRMSVLSQKWFWMSKMRKYSVLPKQ